ncbi:MAG: Mur ligase family protein, partial [Rhodospirillales bacterium]|nr:Mur ligase family protein [Rhodospirillales bacterium]
MERVQGMTDIEIKGLTSDSRRVEQGFLFAALPGAELDGRAFIPQAIERGAAAVLAPPGHYRHAEDLPLPLIIDENPRRRFALMAARFYSGQPSRVAAVTGTNGKTSVVTFLRQIWTQLGCKAASLGTLGVCSPGGETPANLTTPDPVDLHRALHELAAEGVDRLAMEASSHGLSQYRLDGVEVMAAAFTNLTRDHLDYHGLMNDYFGAKLRLFTDILKDNGTAVINADVPYGDAIVDACRRRGLRVMTYGEQGQDI